MRKRLSYLCAISVAFLVGMPVQAGELDISENITALSNQICSIYRGDGTKVAQKVDNAVKQHMAEYEKIADPTPAQMVAFLNRNKHAMTCGEDNKNYMMVSFEHGRAYNQLFNYFLFDELLQEEGQQQIDVNAISFTGPPTGKEPETVLDFMVKEYHDESNSQFKRNEIKELINTFEEYMNGKRFKNFSLAEQQQLIKKASIDINDR